jgi:two-component system, chemotaxis family, CheB/CheR fusion protein
MSQEKDFYIVAIGASAGGLDAVQHFFSNIPNNTNVAYIVIQHLSPNFKSLMPELLSKYTGMQIYTAENHQTIQPNFIYLNQKDKNIGIKDNKFILINKAPKNNLNLPIDIFFHMLGVSYKERAIGVILSGTGSDGSRGIKTIKEHGGLILVQEPTTCQFDGMPNSAILTNTSDFILPPKEIAEKIVQYTSKNIQLDTESTIKSKNEKTFQAILSEIHKYTGVNFKNYKNNTLIRRLEKRMNLHNIDNIEKYYSFIKNSDTEKKALNQEFLIRVTSFFRDTEAFNLLKAKAIPEICANKNKQEKIRIWVPGCSSGEEVYSIAILIDDYIKNKELNLDFKIFATDIDKKALLQAGTGTYSINNCIDIGKKYFDEYFIKSKDDIQIIKRIREKIIFSYHDVTHDPPFIKIDLVSCRNLLIYFDNNVQKSVLAGFQFALNKNGFLFLGSSESLGDISGLFHSIDNKYKIFQNINENKRLTKIKYIEDNLYNISEGKAQFLIDNPQREVNNKSQEELFYYKYLSKKHSPVSIFVDKDFNIKFILGDFKKWFSQTDGIFSNNLLNMVNKELSSIIRNSIRKVIKSEKSVCIENLVYKNDIEDFSTDLFFECVHSNNPSDKTYLVQFGASSPNKTDAHLILSNKDISDLAKQQIEDLEQELKESKTKLQNVVEELETTNEELQSSNEELMSSNEELQSSNEELQSVNEELYTVNAEFQEKNNELTNLNNDITNLLNSTDIGTIFIDINFNIRKFTPSIKEIFHLEENDIGRSLTSFASSFEEDTRKSIIADSKIALEKLKTFEREIKDNKGNWFLQRISPFITNKKTIEGVVITFVNINSLKKAKHELINTEQKLTTALEAGNMAWWEMQLPSGNVIFSKSKAEMLGRNPDDFKHYSDFTSIVHPDDYNITMESMKNHLEGKTDIYECQYRIKNIKGNYQWFQDIGKIISKENDNIIISGIVIEVTNKKQTELMLLDAIKKAETSNVYKNQFLANMSHEIRTPLNGIIGFSSLLRNDELTTSLRNNYIDIIESSSSQLLNLITDIIDLSKIEAGELKIIFEDCDINYMLKELEITFNELKNQKAKDNLVIKAKIPEYSEKLLIKTDPLRLKQILVNLINNALKFTENGKIEFGYKMIDNKIVFDVTDTGIGIPKNKINLIFERFQQLIQTNKAKYDGTGLGLAITKGIVNLLGGSISVTSKKDEGSIFTFDIPYYKTTSNSHFLPNETKNKLIDTDLFNNKKILVAEDDSINRLFMSKLLEELSFEILWACNGIEAVEAFKKYPDISVILIDIRMPLLDGHEAAKKILETNPNAKIIAQTAYAMSSDREKCLSNGFIDYISKPIKKNELIEILKKWVH